MCVCSHSPVLLFLQVLNVIFVENEADLCLHLLSLLNGIHNHIVTFGECKTHQKIEGHYKCQEVIQPILTNTRLLVDIGQSPSSQNSIFKLKNPICTDIVVAYVRNIHLGNIAGEDQLAN